MIRVLHSLCRSCDLCVAVCPQLALWMEGDRLLHRPERCVGSGACIAVCPARALVAETPPVLEAPPMVEKARSASSREPSGDAGEPTP